MTCERGFFIWKSAFWGTRGLFYLLLGVIWLFLAQTVQAHGGGILRVGNEPVGTYAVSVWVNPPEPRTNETLHITVGIAGADQAPVLDADVQIDMFAAGSDQPVISAAATTEQSVNRLFYETNFPRIEPGQYDVVVRINGTTSSGVVTFPLEVQPAGRTSWVIAGLVGIGLIMVGFVVVSRQRQQGGGKRPSRPTRPSHNRYILNR